jgi:hypothetical protein
MARHNGVSVESARADDDDGKGVAHDAVHPMGAPTRPGRGKPKSRWGTPLWLVYWNIHFLSREEVTASDFWMKNRVYVLDCLGFSRKGLKSDHHQRAMESWVAWIYFPAEGEWTATD